MHIPEDEQGQGDATESKIRGIRAQCKIGLDLFAASLRRYPWQRGERYFHFDLFSGCGHNIEVNCIGSPIAFLLAAELARARFLATFVDINPHAIAALLRHPVVQRNTDSAFCVNGDNAGYCRLIPDVIREYGCKPQYAMGMVVIDPNDYQIPMGDLEWLSGICPRLDYLLNWNSTATLRCLHLGAPRLRDVLPRFGKAYWQVREPQSKHKFALCIGRNRRTNDHRSASMFHLDSPKGQEILESCSTTHAEREALRGLSQGVSLDETDVPDVSRVSAPLDVPSGSRARDSPGERDM